MLHLKITILAIVFSVIELAAQSVCPEGLSHESQKPRGLYINEFFNFTPEDKVDTAHSILAIDADNDGQYEKEDELLTFLRNNHITELTLYDLSNVLNNRRMVYNGYALQHHLMRFISKAKSSYGITQVGAAIGSFAFSDKNKFNKTRRSYACKLSPWQLYFDLGSDTVNKKQKEFDQLKESIKLVKQIYNYNQNFSLYDVSNAHLKIIDRIIPEYEFWNYPDGPLGEKDHSLRDFAYNDFKELLNFVDCIKKSSKFPLFLDVYLGHLGLDGKDDITQARFIDNVADRVYLSAYHQDPDTMFTFVKNRLTLFGKVLNKTKPATEVRIIFSAESVDCIKDDRYNKKWNEFLGNFLKADGSLSCAEALFLNDYERFSKSNELDNQLQGFQWFNYTLLKRNCRTQ